MSNPTLTAAIAPVASEFVNAVAVTKSPSWYAITNKSDDEAEISIYDAIGGWGISAQAFVKEIKAIKAKKLTVRMNTPGGEVFDGTAIYNAIVEHPANVIVKIDGLAASAGSFIALAGNEVRMADNAYMMIHEAHGGVQGTADDMTRYAGVMEKINDNIAAIYEKKSGKDRMHWRNLMAAETWFTAAEAKEAGLVDYVDEPAKKVAANFDLKIYNRVPDSVMRLFTQPEAEPRGDASQALPQEASPMSDTAVLTPPPAQNSAAGTQGITQGNTTTQDVLAALNHQTATNHYERGRIDGLRQGREQAVQLMQEIIQNCPGDYATAVNAFLSGQTPGAVKLAYEAAKREREAMQAQIAALQVENARQVALASAGGYSVGVPTNVSNGGNEFAVPTGTPPEVQAKMEWDANANNCRHGCTEKAWMAYRTRQLNGQVRVLATA